MRTVLFLHSSAGRYGADRQLELLAGGLDASRYRALVVLAEDGELAVALRAQGVEVRVRRLAVVRRALMTPGGMGTIAGAWVADAAALARLARERRVALIHSNTSVTLGGAPAAAIARVPHVWHVREIYTDHARLWSAHLALLGTAAALICVSDATAAPLRGRAASHARVIGDGLGVDPLAGAPPREQARAALGLGPETFACLLLGRISDWKGQDVLVRALAEPALAGVKAVALLAGEPWGADPGPRSRLERLSAGLGVEPRVRMLGFREDVAALYAAADVVVVPSTRPDPLPNAALEAAVAGRCVVASDHGGLPEIVRDGETGVLVRPGDPRALAAALAGLAGDPARRERLGAAAADDVRRRFPPARLLERVQAIYDELLGGR